MVLSSATIIVVTLLVTTSSIFATDSEEELIGIYPEDVVSSEVLLGGDENNFHFIEIPASVMLDQMAPPDLDVPDYGIPLSVNKPLGEVSAVAIGPQDTILAFHRADRTWNEKSFSADYKLNESLGPIRNSTIYVIDANTGDVIGEHGQNAFYMPHGLTVDKQGYIWVTDVGTHQIHKLDPHSFQPILTIGEKLVPGADESHFCQPTDVAVSADGRYVYVADGYCGFRVVKFDAKTGKFLKEFGQPDSMYPAKAGEFFVPHSLVLIEDLNLLCVADRENERIQCFAAGLATGHRPQASTGTFVTKAENIGRIYAIRERHHYLVGVTGEDSEGLQAQMFVMNIDTGKAQTFAKGLAGHALALNDAGMAYVASMHPNQIIQIQL